jgi:transketolase
LERVQEKAVAKVSCRKAFTKVLLEAALNNPRIYAIATDSRGSVTLDGFARELPDQFLELGIAEQNAVALASGLASTGRNVFVAGPACFLCGRSFEQIKIDVAYNRSNVKIIGVSAGVSYGPLGGTHTALHDFASLRALPNIKIFVPSDNVAAEGITGLLTRMEGPAYMRTGRGDVEAVYQEPEAFEEGKAKMVSPGDDLAIIACGEMVFQAKTAAALLENRGIGARVIDMWSLKPLDEAAVLRAAIETGRVLTVEEHSVSGGLGEAVSHLLGENHPVRMKILGFPDEEYQVGKNSELFHYYGLDAEGIVQAALSLLR